VCATDAHPFLLPLMQLVCGVYVGSPGAVCSVCAAGNLQNKPNVYDGSVAEESLHTARHVGGVSCFEGVDHELCSAFSIAPTSYPPTLPCLQLPQTRCEELEHGDGVSEATQPLLDQIMSLQQTIASKRSEWSSARAVLQVCALTQFECLDVRGVELECHGFLFLCTGTAVSLLAHTHDVL
jgi:hypothetical protein